MNIASNDTPNMFTLAHLIENTRDNITCECLRIDGRLAFLVYTDGAPDEDGLQLVTISCAPWYNDATMELLNDYAPGYVKVAPFFYQFRG